MKVVASARSQGMWEERKTCLLRRRCVRCGLSPLSSLGSRVPSREIKTFSREFVIENWVLGKTSDENNGRVPFFMSMCGVFGGGGNVIVDASQVSPYECAVGAMRKEIFKLSSDGGDKVLNKVKGNIFFVFHPRAVSHINCLILSQNSGCTTAEWWGTIHRKQRVSKRSFRKLDKSERRV